MTTDGRTHRLADSTLSKAFALVSSPQVAVVILPKY